MSHQTSRLFRTAVVLAVAVIGLSFVTQSSTTPPWLAARAKQERELAAHSNTVHDFQFTDHLRTSGITFRNHIVDDAGRAYKAVHYDHGTGMCAADVDGDGLPDLYFTTQLGENELWRNLGHGKFANVTESAGLRMTDQIAVGCAFADIDNDGLPDLFVTTVRHGNRLFKNLGGGKFRDITATAGVGFVGHSSGAVFFDYDNDGLPDLLVTNVGVYTTDVKGPGGYYVGFVDAFHGHMHPERADTSILYHNLGGGRFADVTKESGLVDAEWSGDAVILDVNGDGFPDVYTLSMQGQNHLWINEGGKHFRDATAEYFPKTPWGAMGAKVFDFNGDGKLDLFVTDMHSDMFNSVAAGDWAGEAKKSDPAKMPAELVPVKDKSIWGNALFTAAGAGPAWREVSDSLGVETFWPWGPSVDDVNADGWDDIFITGGMNFPFRYGVNSLLLNEGGKHFLPSEFTLGVEPRVPLEQPWFTLSCEPGSADAGSRACGMCKEPRSPESSCRADADGHLTMWSARGSRSSVFVDLDGDGDLDLVTSEFNGPPQILLSDLSARHHINFLKIRLGGTRSNREGLGAQVTVVLPDGRRILKVMDGKSGYLGQSDLPLYFGLAAFDRAASIEVRWPSGTRQTVGGPILSGRSMEITEP
jgi:enediyne biosynthesis protein E4